MSDSQDALLIKKRARRRLIGAVALVLFVVIVLPMVLDKEPRPLPNELSVQIPRQDSGSFKTRVLPPAVAPGKSEGSGEAAKTGVPSAATSAAPSVDPKPASKGQERPLQKEVSAAKAEVAPATEPARKSDARSSPAAVIAGSEAQRAQTALSDESWVIPMGAFANPENVRQLQVKLGAAGVKSITEMLKTAEGEKIRVRGGPFKTQAEAEKAREAIKAAGMDAGAVTVR